MPAVITAVLLMLVATGSASANKPLSEVQGSGSRQASAPWVAASLLYAQDPDFNGAFSSQNDTNGMGNFATVYDNFTLGTATSLTQVQWVGSYFNPAQQGNITAFTLTFWSDNAGQPGSALATFNVNGTNNESFLGLDNIGDPTYLYTMDVDFAAAAGTQYWLSVVPDLGFPPQWGWETSSQGDGLAYQDFFDVRSPLASDLAFALFGNSGTTPEPGTLVLLGTGILGLAGTIRRKLF
jgi:hypothetical protein